jgi:hypothetical protein
VELYRSNSHESDKGFISTCHVSALNAEHLRLATVEEDMAFSLFPDPVPVGEVRHRRAIVSS